MFALRFWCVGFLALLEMIVQSQCHRLRRMGPGPHFFDRIELREAVRDDDDTP